LVATAAPPSAWLLLLLLPLVLLLVVAMVYLVRVCGLVPCRQDRARDAAADDDDAVDRRDCDCVSRARVCVIRLLCVWRR
jgi:hypothetical protein